MKTIVQEYGPFYGEPVNGTVMGRPNGSVYVPNTNKISMSIDEDYRYMVYAGGKTQLILTDSTGTAVNTDLRRIIYTADSQDLASNVALQIFSDSDLTTLVGDNVGTAGIFNGSARRLYNIADSSLTDGQTLYLICNLMNNGTKVAVSDVIEITMVVPA